VTSRRLMLTALFLLCGVTPVASEPPSRDPEIVVMIGGEDGAGGMIVGAGIVFAATESDIYIATARHVVERSRSLPAEELTVTFHGRRGVPIAARLADQRFGRDVDLAALLVDAAEAPPLDLARRWVRLSRPLQVGEPVWLIGQGDGRPWATSPAGEPLTAVQTTRLRVRSSTVTGGMSGGGGFDEEGLLVGMIVRDASPEAELLPIRYVLELLGEVLPVGLTAPSTGSPAEQVSRERMALVAGSIPVRAEAETLSLPFHTLRQGDRVTVLGEGRLGWLHIRMGDGREGYVLRSADLRIRDGS